jgi:putative acetyltransferase
MRGCTIREEGAADREGIRNLHRVAFGQAAEADLVDALGQEGHSRMSLVAEAGGAVAGHVLLSALSIAGPSGTVPALALAPLAVLPALQRRGIGADLVRRCLDVARDRGHRIVIVVGSPRFYSRFGFSARLALPLQSPYAGEHFQAVELMPGALDGVSGRVEYPPPFQVGT